MSTPHPPVGPGGPEYLEQGGGAPLAGTRRPALGRKKLLLGGGIVAALALAGGGVWAAMSFLGQGPQPAEALPASTLGYASLDLDPSGGQKLEALGMLEKFPAFEKELGLDTDDDLREQLFEEAGLGESCEDLSYVDDVEPWLGSRFAMAVVDLGEDQPAPVAVLQVQDRGAAEQGLEKLRDCAGSEEPVGWSVGDEWAVVAETDGIADDVVAETEEASLADDADFGRWTDEVGDAGVVNLYAAPAAGPHLADSFGTLLGLSAMGATFESGEGSSDPAPVAGGELPEEVRELLEEFEGAAATVRFDDGALELEMAGDAALTQQGFTTTDRGDDVVASLPQDTAAALGIGFAEGWFGDVLDRASAMSGGMSMEELVAQAEIATGLDLPEDAETLAGESAALVVSGDIDGDALANSETPEGLPIGVKVLGDPEAVEGVLDKVRAQLGPEGDYLLSKAGDDGETIAISPDEEYLAELAADGGLGDSDVFTNVVREADRASGVLFVDFDAGDGWLVDLAGDDPEAAENLEPLQGLGLSAWAEEEAGHVVLRVTTD